MNEKASILMLLIIGVWFFTSDRWAAFYQVLTYGQTVTKTDPNAPNDAGYTPDEKKAASDLEKKPLNGIPGVNMG